MTITSFPFDGQATTEAQFSQLFRELHDSAVIGASNESSLQVSVDTSTALTLRVAPGAAIVRGFMMNSDANVSVSVDAVASGQRIDTVVLRLDPASNSISVVVAKGSSTAGPTLTQTDSGIYELPLADVTVSSASALSVSDRRPFASMRVGVWNTNTRPSSPRIGKMGFNTTLGTFECWNGSAWRLPRGFGYRGHKSGTTDANGDIVVNHGLGFTPSYVMATSRNYLLGLQSTLVAGVHNVNATSFTVRFACGTGTGRQDGTLYLIVQPRDCDFDWVAYE